MQRVPCRSNLLLKYSSSPWPNLLATAGNVTSKSNASTTATWTAFGREFFSSPRRTPLVAEGPLPAVQRHLSTVRWVLAVPSRAAATVTRAPSLRASIGAVCERVRRASRSVLHGVGGGDERRRRRGWKATEREEGEREWRWAGAEGFGRAPSAED
eukprot:scaffold3649_cov30-Tisochrysis_lutea.AAC.7